MADRPDDRTGARTLRLTDLGRRAIGVTVLVPVPLLDLPWRDDARDRKKEGRR